MKSVGIVNYQINNLSSIYYSIKNLKNNPIFVSEYIETKFDILIIPGTGSFAEGMKYLLEKKLDKLIYNHISRGGIIIAICLGFQMLFQKSYEFGKTNGLGVLEGDIVPFGEKYDKPNIGWLKVTSRNNNKSLQNLSNNIDGRYFYHVHSYYLENDFNDFTLTYSFNKNLKFTSSIYYKNIYGFQFHPEKSGNNGNEILSKIIK